MSELISHTAIVENGVVLERKVKINHNAIVLAGLGDENVTVVGSGAIIGAGAIVYPGVKIGSGAHIMPGAVVINNVPPNAIVTGNPGGISGYVGDLRDANLVPTNPKHEFGIEDLGINGCTLHHLPYTNDIRGSLCVAEYQNHIPFVIRRFFWIYDVPSSEIRGEHAHKKLHQYLICIRGSVSVVLDDGQSRCEVILDNPRLGLHILPLVWGIQYKYSEDAILLVAASEKYDSNDYLRNYDEFLKYVAHYNV